MLLDTVASNVLQLRAIHVSFRNFSRSLRVLFVHTCKQHLVKLRIRAELATCDACPNRNILDRV